MLVVRTLLLACLAALATAGSVEKKYNITIGYLPAVRGDMTQRQGITISGAVTAALDELNNSTDILPDVKILLDYRDTRSQPAVDLIADMASKNVVAFFGPEGSCYFEAIVAHTKNLPMFSYRCADKEAIKLSNFVKMDPTSDQAMKSVISLLRYYRWNKFAIIFEEQWVKETQVLQAYAAVNEMTVNLVRPVPQPTVSSGWDIYRLTTVVKETKKFTRIYVYLGSSAGLVNMMAAMDSQKLFNYGEYMVIFVDLQQYIPYESLQYITESDLFSYHCANVTPEFQTRARSLLVVVTSPPAPAFEEFEDRVRKFDKEEPFRFPDPFGDGSVKKFISLHGAYLYDSIKLYAKALDDLIKEDTQTEKLTRNTLISITTNASRIVSRVVMKSPYQSISGLPLHLDAQGVSKGNFVLLAFKPTTLRLPKETCSHTMVPVAYFEPGDGPYPTYKLHPRTPIDWPDSVKPDDEPSCGYHAENCPTLLTFLG